MSRPTKQRYKAMESLFLSVQARKLVNEIRNTDGYGYGLKSRQAAIGNAICKLSAPGNENDSDTIATIVATLSEYNELITALSERQGNE